MDGSTAARGCEPLGHCWDPSDTPQGHQLAGSSGLAVEGAEVALGCGCEEALAALQ